MTTYSGIININFLHALLSYTKFGVLTGINSSKEGLDYKKWTETDRKKWHGISKNISGFVLPHGKWGAKKNIKRRDQVS